MKFAALIIEDQELVRQGLSLVLKQNFPEVDLHQAGSGEEGLALLQNNTFDIMLLDMGLPGMSGLDVARHVRKHYPSIKVLVVTQYNGEALIKNLFKIGIHSFFLKSNAAIEIKDAVNTVMAGNQYIPESLRSIISPSITLPSVIFSKREAEVLLLLKMGRSSREISERLGLKENTINSYREDMLQKTNTNNVAQLISYAYENGILR